jgi:hypothetical protein
MSNNRFSNLSLLHIERDLANNIKSEEVLNIFAVLEIDNVKFF